MSGEKDSLHRFLVWMAMLTFVVVVGVTTYGYLFESGDELGVMEYRRGNLRLEDGKPEGALREFDTVLKRDPNHAPSHLGRALALMALRQNDEALMSFDLAVEIRPDFSAVYANRGILHDRMGRYSEAISDYHKALSLDPELGEGPGWITRFLRNQDEPPPTIADRARYLEAELKKPAWERKLRYEEIDQKQRSYKYEGPISPEK